MSSLFELRPGELNAIIAALESLPRNEMSGDCVWLHVGETERVWKVVGKRARFELRVQEAHEHHVEGWLPVPDRILQFAQLMDPDPGTAARAERVECCSGERAVLPRRRGRAGSHRRPAQRIRCGGAGRHRGGHGVSPLRQPAHGLRR